MAGETILTLSGPGLPPYAARGLTQTLEPIDGAGRFARDLNGALIDLSPPQMRKYRITISGKDVDPPALDQIWPGVSLVIGSISELGYLTSDGPPARSVVPGSERTEGAWTYYRPEFDAIVTKKTEGRDEWGGLSDWTLELEEA